MADKYLLFDFDGVIADSFAIGFEVAKMSCPDITDSDYKKLFEGNIYDPNEHYSYHSEKCNHDLDFFEHYLPRLRARVNIFPGMLDTLKSLSLRYNLIIITSTGTDPIVEFLNKNNANVFKEILGMDFHKSKVEKIKYVLNKYKLNNNDCLFITDTVGDIKEARQVNVQSVAVSWGVHEYSRLSTQTPFRIVDKVSELEKAIDDYFNQ